MDKSKEPSNKFGREVTLEEAQAYVENYRTILDTLIEEILPLVPTDAPEAVQKCVTFYKSRANAFVFDASQIKPFFEAPDEGQYLIVHAGAVGDHLTLVCAGLSDGADPGLLYLAPKVPREQPPFYRNIPFSNTYPLGELITSSDLGLKN
jgi:hypothetical protein